MTGSTSGDNRPRKARLPTAMTSTMTIRTAATANVTRLPVATASGHPDQGRCGSRLGEYEETDTADGSQQQSDVERAEMAMADRHGQRVGRERQSEQQRAHRVEACPVDLRTLVVNRQVASRENKVQDTQRHVDQEDCSPAESRDQDSQVTQPVLTFESCRSTRRGHSETGAGHAHHHHRSPGRPACAPSRRDCCSASRPASLAAEGALQPTRRTWRTR